jgi:hypothetical protein
LDMRFNWQVGSIWICNMWVCIRNCPILTLSWTLQSSTKGFLALRRFDLPVSLQNVQLQN